MKKGAEWMNRYTTREFRRQIETVFAAGTLVGLSDGQLLERFGAGRQVDSEAALALLVERHGPMVLRVCQSVLLDPHDAEDAFQATFLVLVHRGTTIRKAESLGPWLHGVALRVATSDRAAIARRRFHERALASLQPSVDSICEVERWDTNRVIQDEIECLPDRYRAPIVLCDLEAHSLDAAARQLGWPLGTVKSRLNRGRLRLRERLFRRGLAPVLAGSVLSQMDSSAVAAIPEGLVERTVLSALAAAGATARSGVVSAAVLTLANRARRTLLMEKITGSLMGAMAALGLVTVGIGQLGGRSPIDPGAQVKANGLPTPLPGQVNAARSKPSEPTTPRTETKAKAVVRPSRRDDEIRRVPITIAGQAKDEAGQPIAGAMIYVTNANHRRSTNEPDLLATARTDPEGRFELKDLPLPVLRPDPGPLPAVEVGLTDENGRATLRLRSGEYTFTAEPSFGSLDLPAQGSIRVDKALVVEPGDVSLPRGAAVVLKALDAGTGDGIQGVGFGWETDASRERRELQS
jgi:RNA polymerase sigma factor (sigma-70 family)